MRSSPRSRVLGSIEVRQPSGLGFLEMRRGTFVTQPYPRHWHEEFQFCLVTGGAGYLDRRGISHFLPAGSLFLMPPAETHSNHASPGGCSFLNMYIPSALIDDVAAELTEKPQWLPSASQPVIEDPRIRRGFFDLYRTLESSPSCAQQESSLYTFLTRLIARHTCSPGALAPGGIESAAVRVTRDFLQENYAQQVSLADLSKLTNLSPFYLHRTFCRQMGMPPHAYQVQVRIARAKSLLQRSWSLADVAIATGFADQSHFTRQFKRHIGVTPGHYLAR